MGVQVNGTTVFGRLFPGRADNAFRGHRLALWLFGFVVVAKGAQSVVSIFAGYTAATGADGIPLDSYTPAGAQTVLSVFALLGLSRLIVLLFDVLVLVRYRSMIPLMLAVLSLDYLGSRLVLLFLPIVRTGAPPGGGVNVVIFGLMIAGLVLSLWNRAGASAERPGSSGAT